LYKSDGGAVLRKYLLSILSAAVLASLLLSSCAGAGSSKAGSSSSSSVLSSSSQTESSSDIASAASASVESSSAITESHPKMMEDALNLSVKDTQTKYEGIDICIGNLVFDDAKKVPSETLFTFFCYITSASGEYPDGYITKWYNKKTQKYNVPVSDIDAVLNKYFDGVKFDATKIHGYNAKTKAVESFIDGFGGGRFAKLVSRDIVSKDTLKIKVDFYDDQYKKVEFSKTYTIKYTDTTYKYQSIKEDKFY
jgi:hypothetical protein